MKRATIVLLAVLAGWMLWRIVENSSAALVESPGAFNSLPHSTATQPTAPDSDSESDSESESESDSESDPDTATPPTMADVLQMARESLETMQTDLDDYTARFVKQERDTKGVLGESNEISMKVRTRFCGPENDSPRCVYLRFNAPTAVMGREVIWGEQLYEGQMAVHEVGFILGLKTIWLDPNGMIAMQGQRFPISEIGLVKLVEKLIERGEEDRENPDVSVSITEKHDFDGIETHLIQVRRVKPGGGPDDFSLAEIVVDPDRKLILSYRSFGWPTSSGEAAPLLESYAYHDLKTNVGLTELDFQTTNPEYSFPRF